ncbi:calcium-binding protein [Cucumis sativus]|uniref:EF-hand domain-containing protein n=1 Tax=Cucumis sativus TaxID=3659 RepID=A0A0A0LNG6_CUCSA|nr:calcium-binding protein [Cucumis sativus]KGN62524.1 hypothetical protein Csa_022579 [Cucumis sativus]
MSTNPLKDQPVPAQGNYMSEQEASNLIKKYDKNGDSILTKDELTALIIEQAASHHHQQIKPQKVEPKVNIPDEKASCGPYKMRLSKDEMREIFLEHDIDGDGYLTRSELVKAFNMCGSFNSFSKANYALNLADANGDGFICLDELDKVLEYADRVINKTKK